LRRRQNTNQRFTTLLPGQHYTAYSACHFLSIAVRQFCYRPITVNSSATYSLKLLLRGLSFLEFEEWTYHNMCHPLSWFCNSYCLRTDDNIPSLYAIYYIYMFVYIADQQYPSIQLSSVYCVSMSSRTSQLPVERYSV